jgi:hypothetical protein
MAKRQTKSAQYGAEVARFQSNSGPHFYTVRISPQVFAPATAACDLTCNCKGWAFGHHKRPDPCWHVREAATRLAQVRVAA